MVFSQFKIPANLAQLAVPKMHCLYANAVVQPSVQHCPCYMAWKTRVHTWCRHCHLCVNAPMWRETRWLLGLFDPPSYYWLWTIVILMNPFEDKRFLFHMHLTDTIFPCLFCITINFCLFVRLLLFLFVFVCFCFCLFAFLLFVYLFTFVCLFVLGVLFCLGRSSDSFLPCQL